MTGKRKLFIFIALDVESFSFSNPTEELGLINSQFLYTQQGDCRNCDSLTVVVVAHFDHHLAGRHLVATGRADDCFSRFQLLFVINIFQNRVQFDPRRLRKLICS